MWTLIKGLFVLLVVLVAVAAGALFLGPRERIERGAPASLEGRGVAEVLVAREAVHDDITPGTEARVIWAGEPEEQTPLSILYLHGFSATSEEIRPVPDRVAEALGANLIFARLTGHGRDGAALAAARAGGWVDDTALFLDLARAAGERVLVIGTSTGGTLAAYAATDPEMARDMAGIVMLSPNFRVANPAAVLTELGFARHLVPLLAGAERGFAPLNDRQARFWTTRYGTDALTSLGTLMRETRARDLAAAEVPVLAIFSDLDQVVSAAATREALLSWGGPVTLVPLDLPEAGADPFHHVVAGDILSPAMTGPVTETVLGWIDDSL